MQDLLRGPKPCGEVEFHLKKALENGLIKAELVVVMTHIAFYAGWPTAASGLVHLKKVVDQLEGD